MNTTIALRRVSTPTAPMVNRIAERTMNGVTLSMSVTSSGWSSVCGSWSLGRVAARSSTERCTASMSSAAPGERTVPRAASTRETEASAAVPSGSRAGVSTALWRAKTPGAAAGRGAARSRRSRGPAAAARSAWVGFGVSRSRWASTIAPTAAVISSAQVTSKAKT